LQKKKVLRDYLRHHLDTSAAGKEGRETYATNKKGKNGGFQKKEVLKGKTNNACLHLQKKARQSLTLRKDI